MITSGFYHPRFGHFELLASANGIMAIKQIAEIDYQLGADAFHPFISRSKKFLKDYFDGKNPIMNISLDTLKYSPFQKEVLALVSKIPYGHTRSYLEIALELGDKNLTRAVGHANATNPVPIFIPCHRVIGSDGDLKGYIFGKSMKEALLALESPDNYSIQGKFF